MYKCALPNSYIQIQKRSMITLMFNLKLKFFGYILQIDLSNSPPSFIRQRLSVKCIAEWKYLALILSEEIRDVMYFPSKEHKK